MFFLTMCGTAPVTPPAQACSPDLERKTFTCPGDFDGVIVDPPVLRDPPMIKDDGNDPHYPPSTATVFDTRASAPPSEEWVNTLRDWKSRQNRTPVDEMINTSLAEYNNGSDDPTEQEELLQLPSSIN